jgi:hypothetical protein
VSIETLTCPKCGATSGGDWSQCKESCPMLGSPHNTSEHERRIVEVIARAIMRGDEQTAKLAPPRLIHLLSRAYDELRGQVRALHSLVDQADPNDPIWVALTKVGLARKPPDWTVKTIDPSKKHAVTLVFLLDEEVTPQLFAQKVARACSSGALRPGEAVMVKDGEIACVIGEKATFAPWLAAPKPTKPTKPAKKQRRM